MLPRHEDNRHEGNRHGADRHGGNRHGADSTRESDPLSHFPLNSRGTDISRSTPQRCSALHIDAVEAIPGSEPFRSGSPRTASCMERSLAAQALDWWLAEMYLRNPVPLPVNSNPGMVLPRFDRGRTGDATGDTVDYAARFIRRLLDYKQILDRSEEFPSKFSFSFVSDVVDSNEADSGGTDFG